MKRRRGVIFSAEALFAMMVGLSILFLLIGHFGEIMGQMASVNVEMHNRETFDKITKILLSNPGGHLFSGEGWGYIVSDSDLYGNITSQLIELNLLGSSGYLYPYWPDAISKGYDVTVPGLAVYDTRAWSPVTYVLHSKKVDNLDVIVEWIVDNFLSPEAGEGISITIRSEDGSVKKSVSRMGRVENNIATYTKTVMAWLLDVSERGNEKMHLVTVTITVNLVGG